MTPKPAARSSANTELHIGMLQASIGLFGTQSKPGKEQSFETAGPNGGRLRYEMRGVVAEDQTEEAVPVRDALTDTPAPEPEPATPTNVAALEAAFAGATAEPSTVAGEFRQVLVEEGTDLVVKPEDVRRGVRLDEDRFVDCTDQIAAIEERTKLDRIEVVKCIDSTQVRRERVIGSYYIGAQDGKDAPVLRLLFEALRIRREVAVVKYTTRSRQNLGVIVPNFKTGTLMLLALVFAEDFRPPPAKATAIQNAEVTTKHVEMMTGLLGTMHGKVDVFDDLRDDALVLREELLTRARAGEMDASVVDVPIVEPAIDLEEALTASLAAVASGKLTDA